MLKRGGQDSSNVWTTLGLRSQLGNAKTRRRVKGNQVLSRLVITNAHGKLTRVPGLGECVESPLGKVAGWERVGGIIYVEGGEIDPLIMDGSSNWAAIPHLSFDNHGWVTPTCPLWGSLRLGRPVK